MAADARRELVLAAATRSFARTGFAGTSTDTIAREAQVSQPYVIRIFGTKQDLFLATYDRAAATVYDSFAAVVGDPAFDGSRAADRSGLGSVYSDLLRDRDLALVLLQGFAAADSPMIRTRARECLGRLNSLLLEAGLPASLARDFIAHGMLLTVLMALKAPENPSIPQDLRDLVACVLPDADHPVRIESD
ncbi:MAG TPA: TetR/AcrR family transcriptional regulator [Nocardioides sp.]|jgi:AcrR family transcriptional regulator